MQKRDHEIPHKFRIQEVLEKKHNIENEINRLLREENDAAMLRDIQKVAEETQLAEAVRKKDDVKRRRIIAQATVINRHLEAWLVEEMESIKKRRAALLKRLNENQQELEKLQDSAEIETKILEIKHKEDIWRSQEALAVTKVQDLEVEKKAQQKARKNL